MIVRYLEGGSKVLFVETRLYVRMWRVSILCTSDNRRGNMSGANVVFIIRAFNVKFAMDDINAADSRYRDNAGEKFILQE